MSDSEHDLEQTTMSGSDFVFSRSISYAEIFPELDGEDLKKLDYKYNSSEYKDVSNFSGIVEFRDAASASACEQLFGIPFEYTIATFHNLNRDQFVQLVSQHGVLRVSPGSRLYPCGDGHTD